MKRSFIFLHIAVLLGGLTGIFGKLITVNAASLVWFRVAISSILLYIILKLTKKFRHYGTKEIIRLSASGLLPTFFWAFFYASIKYSNVSIGVVCFCLTGFFTAVLNPIINKKKLAISELFLSALTLAGVSLIFHFDTSYRTGIVLGTISSFFGSLYIMANEKLVKRYDSTMINYYQLLGATIGLGLLMPVYSIALAMLLFKENKELNGSFYLGLSLILVSVLFQMLKYLPSKNRR
jgi:drug/metabolite transporter (DMT)-like permease